MNKDNILKFLIPVAAVVVILESVVIVSGIVKKGTTVKVGNNEVPVTESQVSTASQAPKDAVATMLFGVDNKSMQVGKTYKVVLSLDPKKDFAMDATDIYVKYDADAFTVGKLTFNEAELGKPTSGKVSTKQKGLIVVNYWISDPKGFSYTKGKLVNLVGIEVTPKKAGTFNFEIATGDSNGNSATMIVEKSTAKVLPFASDKLTVKVAN